MNRLPGEVPDRKSPTLQVDRNQPCRIVSIFQSINQGENDFPSIIFNGRNVNNNKKDAFVVVCQNGDHLKDVLISLLDEVLSDDSSMEEMNANQFKRQLEILLNRLSDSGYCDES